MSNGRKPHGAAAAGDAFERFEEDELAGEVTRLEPGAMLAEQPTNLIDEGPPMPFLVCESGKDTGKEYVVAVGENGIGRSIDNEVILTDISVSRKHLKVLRNEHGELRLRDLGSGNGTLLNGTRVHDAPLKDGDRIELGETVLVVRIPPDEDSPATNKPQPRVRAVDGRHAQAVADGAITDESASPPGPGQPSFASPPPPAGPPSYGQGAPYGYPPAGSQGGAPQPQAGFGQAGFGQAGFGQAGFGQAGFGQPPAYGQPGAPSPMAGAPPGYAPTPTAVATPAPRGGGRGLLILVGIFGALVLVGAGAALAIAIMRPDAPVAPAADPALYARGAEAYTARRWDEADVAFRTILAAQPSDARAATYVQRIQEARAHDQQLTAARAAYEAGDGRTALAQLASVPPTSPLAADVANLRAAASERVAAGLVADARIAFTAGRRDEAAVRLGEAAGFAPTSAAVAAARTELGLAGVAAIAPSAVVPPATPIVVVSPTPAVAAVQIPAAVPTPTPAVRPTQPTVVRPAQPTAVAVRPTPQNAQPVAHPVPHPTPTPTPAPVAGRGGAGTDRVLAAYRSGDFVGAARLARDGAHAASASDGRRLTAMADEIDRFARDYARVRSAGADLGSVLRQVQSVISLDEQISGGQAYARALTPRLADALVTSANDAWARGRVPDACLKVRQATDLDGRNPRARDLVRRCEAKAAEMITQAQGAERTNRLQAQGLYRDVLALVPQSSATYQRAYARMQALNHAAPTPTAVGGTGPRRVPIIVDEDE